jgi:hypothetical protein
MMKRTSTTLFLECPNTVLPVPWTGIENVVSNIESAYQSPTKEVAITSWETFVASGQELEVIPNPLPPTPVVRSIDMRRLRLALLQMNLLDDIDAVVAAQPRSAQIEWEFATEVKSDHPLVVQFVAALNLDIDAIIDLAESFT